MKKKIIALLLCTTIIGGSIATASAANSYIFTASWDSNRIIEYDALCELCALVAYDIGNGNLSGVSAAASVRINFNGTYYYIGVYNASSLIGYIGANAPHAVYVAVGPPGVNQLNNIESYAYSIKESCNNISTKITSVATNVSNILAGLNYMISHWGNNYYCSYSEYGDPAQPYPVHPVPKITGDIMLANVNDHIGDKITYISEADQESTYLIVGAGYNQYNYLQVTIENTSQTQTYSVYLCDSKRNMFKANTESWQYGSGSGSGSSSSYDDTNLLAMLNTLGQKIDRIYDWLDNADLSTNQTIINMVNDSTQDITDALPNFNQVNGLFRAAFSPTKNGHQASDWTSAFSYFTHLWSD